MFDLTTEAGVVALMESSQTEEQWNANCDQVKAANNGYYPGFWFRTFIASGFAGQTAARWDGDANIKVVRS